MAEQDVDQTVLGEDLNASDDSQEQNENYLEQFVGEGKKYATVEEAANALAKKAIHADKFINDLKAENAQYKEKATTLEAERKTADEILEIVSRSSLTKKESFDDDEEELTTNKSQQLLTPEQVAIQIQNALKEKDAKERASSQVKKTWDLLISEDGFGSKEKAKAAIKKYVGDSPERKQLADSMGLTDPNGLLTLLKASAGEQETFSRDRSDSFVPPAGGAKKSTLTWSECKELKRKDRAKFDSFSFQRKIAKAADENPNFYNT